MAVCRECGRKNPRDARFCNGCAAPLTPKRAPERRKPATLLFCDVSGSTAMGERLDAEAVRELMFSYFHEMRSAIEGHGGTVEKFVGDAVMAVFGVPEAHEDDPLRACRAAAEMQQRLAALNDDLVRRYGSRLAMRIGVNTGEVVAGDPAARETFVSGDAVNVAARLEQAAAPGEVLLGEQTFRLVRDVLEAEPVAPLRLKGKSAPLAAHRLLSVAVGPARPLAAKSRFVGRDGELDELQRLFEQALRDRRLQLATVVGEPGVGKSRLVSELVAAAASRARVLTGRCLSYGEGITYWPLAEIVRAAAGIHDEHDARQARARVDRLGLEPRASGALATLVGLDALPLAAELIPRAVSELVAALAAERPLLLVIEDVHWGEPALLDLLLHLRNRVEAPVLLISTARPELLDSRPDWPVAVRLDVLTQYEIRALLRSTGVTDSEQEAVVRACGGNPLFAEELAAFLAERPGPGAVPPTLGALLAARLDLLPERERSAAERGSVEGELFHRGAVQALGEDGAAQASLAGLTGRDLIRPAQAQFLDEVAFRFKHALVRDAAYNGTAKRLRAELHERFAGWLEQKAGDRLTEYEEILGYHLEQAYRNRAQLGPLDDRARTLRARAGETLASAGRRASTRWDLRAAITLLERAASVFPKGDPRRLELLFELGRDLLWVEPARAEDVLSEAIDASAGSGDPRLAAHAEFASLQRQSQHNPPYSIGEVAERRAREAIRSFEELGDEQGLAAAWHFIAGVHANRFEFAAREEALGRALAHAANAGDRKQEAEIRIFCALALLYGPAPLVEVSRIQHENLAWAQANGSPRLEAASLVLGGRLRAMRGNFEEARVLIARGAALFDELGLKRPLLAVSWWAAEVEELTGDVATAERAFRGVMEAHESAGASEALPELAFLLARLADLQGRYEEAESLLPLYEESAASDDRWLQIERRCWRARVLARRGEPEEAVRLAREALALAPPREAVLERTAVLIYAARILSLTGHLAEAASITEEALRLFEQKGLLVSADQARALLAQLRRRIASGP
jgi:class 3 adenylate cyclase